MSRGASSRNVPNKTNTNNLTKANNCSSVMLGIVCTATAEGGVRSGQQGRRGAQARPRLDEKRAK
jgi:hypothetical protein